MMDSNTLISIRNTESATDNDRMREQVQNAAYIVFLSFSTRSRRWEITLWLAMRTVVVYR